MKRLRDVIYKRYAPLIIAVSRLFLFVKLACDETCGCGYRYSTLDLSGADNLESFPGQGIENCANTCNARKGCTSFEYNHAGNDNYYCGTYTAGDSNVQKGNQSPQWTSCIKGITIFVK